MKLNRYEVRINTNTFTPELLMAITVPLELIENVDSMSKAESIHVLGSYLLDIFNEMQKNESKQ
jgi:hypothetical protein